MPKILLETDIDIMGDPAASIFHNKLCQFEQGTAEVELTSRRLQGLTYWQAGDSMARHEVAFGVERELFFEHYFRC